MYDIIDAMDENLQFIFTLATNSVEATGNSSAVAQVYNVTDGSVGKNTLYLQQKRGL